MTPHNPTTQASGEDDTADQFLARFLIDRINYERTSDIPYGKREFKLERMRSLLQRLGNPQDGLRAIHVAGSKGKGSTATMIASILTSAGLQTGLFTSPHLHRLEERFRIDGQAISSRELTDLVRSKIEPVVAQMDAEAAAADQPWDTPTFFEIVTAAAFLYFHAHAVDAAVLEVGLGGRLDSTNVCNPTCCVITNISLDHTKQLGTTHGEIAAEKAGILKPSVPLVNGVVHPAALETVTKIANERGCPQWTIHKDFQFSSKPNKTPPEFDFILNTKGHQGDKVASFLGEDPPGDLAGLKLGMWGKHQAANAAVATMTAQVLAGNKELGWRITPSDIRNGLRKASCPARIEVVSDDPLIIVDTAHNVASTWALMATIDGRFKQTMDQRIVIFAISRGKKHQQILDLLVPWCEHIILTKYQENPRGVPVTQLEAACAQTSRDDAGKVYTAEDPAAALRLAADIANNHPVRSGNKTNLICITGSFFLAAEALQLLRP